VHHSGETRRNDSIRRKNNQGETTVDEAAITGEPIPEETSPGAIFFYLQEHSTKWFY
jgi:type II secretory pathway component PulJ